MKKIISVMITMLLVCSTLPAISQSTMAQTDPAGATSTVNTNADTSYHKVTLTSELSNYDVITFTLKGVKTSGTVAGTAVLYGSLNGTDWAALADRNSYDTLTLSNGNNFQAWEFDKTRYNYYRFAVITTGTQVSTYTGVFFGRKEPRR